MTCRKWVVRGVVLAAAAVAVAGGLLYQVWTNPTATRRQVLDRLAEKFTGATIALESAHLRLLGGIALADLRMARRDELDKGDFLYVPSGVLFHDKEQLLDGRLVLRKVELHRPHLRLIRERDGRINLQGILGPVRLDERVPAIVVRQGTIVIEDRGAAPGSPLVELKDVTLTVGNDPISVLSLEGSGLADILGPVRFRARLHRASGAAAINLELTSVPVGPDLMQRLSGWFPEAAVHLRQLQATGSVQAALVYQPASYSPWTYDVTAVLREGSFRHARLPLPLEDAEATARVVNGHVPRARLSARAGTGRIRVTLTDAFWPIQSPTCLQDCAREVECHVEHLAVTPELLAQLPAPCPELARDYSPAGPVALDHFFARGSDGSWRKRWRIRPEGLGGEFAHFRYPLEGITGQIEWEADSSNRQHTAVDLAGRAGDRPLTVRGEVRGSPPGVIDLVIDARDVPLDDRLYRALPEQSQALVRTFLPQDSREQGLRARPMGRGDVTAHVFRPAGRAHFENRYVVAFHNARVRYDQFPLPLDGVDGVLDIRPDHWECRGFRGRHGGGEIHFDGRSFKAGQTDLARGQEEQEADGRAEKHDRVKVAIRGKGIPLDHDFEEALAPPQAPGRAALQRAWRALALRGRLSFAADVIDHPDQPQDIDVTVDVHGCTMRPAFFPYSLQDVAGAVRYAHGRVYIQRGSARHGAGILGLKSGLLELKPGGGFVAWFEGLRAAGVTADDAFLHALPAPVGKVLESLHLHEPLDAETSLTLDAPPDGDRLKAWWDGAAVFRNASLQVGLSVDGVRGQVACRGHHNGRQFESATGDIFFEQATVLNQPLRNVHARAQVLPGSPDVLRVSDLKADLFGGTIGGEARVDFGPDLRYEVLLEALQVRLEEFGKHNLGKDADLQGPIRAALHLVGEGNDLSGLRGNGRFLVDNGKMYRLPPLLDLLKAFPMLRAPDKTAFEQARLVFGIDGPQLRVHQLDLIGSAISLRGQGTVNLGTNLDDSTLNLEFSADWGRVQQLLPPGISDMTQVVSDNTFRIRARGRVGAVRYEEVIFPGVTDPLRKAMGRTP
jgi:hypothetical protein